MEVNSPTRQSFPSGGQRLRKAPAPLWQGQIIERHESSPLPILHVLRIGIRVPGVSQEAGANEYDWHAGVSLHSYCAIFDALSVISRAKSLRAITVPYGICSTYVPLAAGSTTVHPTYACTSAAEPHFPGSLRIESLAQTTTHHICRSERLNPSNPWEFGPWHRLIEMPVEGAWQYSKVSRSVVPQWLGGLSPFPPLASNLPQHPPQSNQTHPQQCQTIPTHSASLQINRWGKEKETKVIVDFSCGKFQLISVNTDIHLSSGIEFICSIFTLNMLWQEASKTSKQKGTGRKREHYLIYRKRPSSP
ncbi:hypothetical protein G5714_010208 [Onychostoma macrolepis]|uniref:Uncharacterized protein n=1 Tax=Onychostoma macrolepis TaxID=369639 RepID=A0A7J6CRC2_9TELE|nr:hypothetical protein G5714_010208 [Onychostoma macrolepis]